MNLLNYVKSNLNFNQITNIYLVSEQDPFVLFYSKKNNQKEERQGWKIHVSATIYNYKKILLLVTKKLIEYQVSFKFLKDKPTFINNINKQTPLQNSGKFITIYPVNVKQFLTLLKVLYILLKRYQGVVIDTDRRYLDSQNVFYRYGIKFPKTASNYLLHKGQKILDQKSLLQYHPDFVNDPVVDNINPQLSGKFIDYQIKYCLNKNPGGFVFYAMENKTKIPRILINVRKNILHSIKKTLIQKRLEEIKLFYQKNHDLKIPRIIDYFYDSDKNLWIVKEYLEGKTLDFFLNDCAIQMKSAINRIDHFQIYLNVIIKLVAITASFHQKKIVLNDIKLTNFLIKKDFEIYFIDPEDSYCFGQYDDPSNNINNVYLSQLSLKYWHKHLDYYKIGLMVIDLICNVNLFLKLDNNLDKLFSYLTDLFGYYNFDIRLLNLIHQLVYQPEKIDLIQFQKELVNIKNKYLFDHNWIPHFNEKILSLIKQKIFILNKTQNKSNNWKINKNTKLFYFSDFLIYFDQYDNLPNDQKILLKQKLKDAEKENFYCQMLSMILNNIDYITNSQVQNQFRIKVKEFIKNNLFISKNVYYVKKEIYIPYIEQGTAGLCLILIYGKHYLKVNDFDQLIDDILSTIKNPFIQKVKFHFGLTGYVFLFLKAYQLWKPNQQYLKDALECCYFMLHQMTDHKTIYDYDYTKLSVKDRKSLKYVVAQLDKILLINNNE